MARASVDLKVQLARPLALKEQLARPLLHLHSYAHSYTPAPTVSLHGQLYEVYTRQVQTISGATLHLVAMAHQNYLNWAAMVTHCMRAHNQWLQMACQRWRKYTWLPSTRSPTYFGGNTTGEYGTGATTA